MNTVHDQFRELIADHCRNTGFTAPELLTEYLVNLLAERVRRVDLIP